MVWKSKKSSETFFKRDVSLLSIFTPISQKRLKQFQPGDLFISAVTNDLWCMISIEPYFAINERGGVYECTEDWLADYNHEFLIKF